MTSLRTTIVFFTRAHVQSLQKVMQMLEKSHLHDVDVAGSSMFFQERAQFSNGVMSVDARWEQDRHQAQPGSSSQIPFGNARHQEQRIKSGLRQGEAILLEGGLGIHFIATRRRRSGPSGGPPSLCFRFGVLQAWRSNNGQIAL